MPILVICEIGVNHNGDFETALKLAWEAKVSGADIAKFQLFKDRPEIEHLRFSEDQMTSIAAYCKSIDIEFACTPFYPEAVTFLDPLVKRHKIASGWTKNPELFNAARNTGKPVIASLGMATRHAVWPYKNLEHVQFLHCVSQYPCPDLDANLKEIGQWWIDGYSDHTTGTTACIAAAALGAKIIEKHFTLDKSQTGPDHICSAEPYEFSKMVQHIRRIEEML